VRRPNKQTITKKSRKIENKILFKSRLEALFIKVNTFRSFIPLNVRLFEISFYLFSLLFKKNGMKPFRSTLKVKIKKSYLFSAIFHGFMPLNPPIRKQMCENAKQK